jgi:signal transduction histidine kinase
LLKLRMVNQNWNYPVRWPDRFFPPDQKVPLILVAAYRGFALAFALALILLDNRVELRLWSDWLIVMIVSVYTILRIIWPLSRRNKIATYSGFSFDLALALCLPIFTGGLYSPFLFYSLSPIMTSAVLFRRRTTMVLAGLPALAAAAGYAVTITTATAEVNNPIIFTISFLGIYAASSILLSWLVYVIKNAYEETKTRAVRDERKRLSRDIHDGMAQTVGIISWKLDLLQKKVAASRIPKLMTEVEEIGQLVTHLKGEAKDVINELRLRIPNDGGFVSGLSQCAAEFTQNYGIKCEFNVTGEEVEIPAPAVPELLCVVREALCNARKYAIASKVELSLRFRSGLIELRVRDDGCGFDQAKESTGHGLVVMNERVKAAGGEMFVISKPGWGTEICVYLFADEGRRRTGGLPSPYARLEV